MISRSSINGRYPVRYLGEIVEFLDSQRRPVTESDRKPGPYPYFGANGQQGTIDGFIFDEPLVLLAEDGGHFDTPGRGIAYRVRGKSWVNNHAHVLRPTPQVDLDYLCRVLENYDVTPFVTGTTRGKLTKGGAEQIPIPLPPLPEQRRIAAILDKADALRAKRRAALDQLNGLTQSIFVEMFGDPITNPKRFAKGALGSLASRIGSGATPLGGDAAYKAEGIALIRSMNVRNGLFLRKDLARIDERQAAKLSNVEVMANDVLLNITGASVARVCRVPEDILPARVNQHVSIIRTGELLSPVFLERLLLFPSMKAKLLQLGDSGGATRQAITKGQLEALDVVLPSIADQRHFAERHSLVEKVCRDQDQFVANADSLFSSLQERAFSGAL